jgi:cell shape-determining protein MreC
MIMSQSRSNTKRNIFVVILIALVGVGLWYIISWTKKFQGTNPPLYSDTTALVFDSKQFLIKKIIALQSTLDAQNASLSTISTLEAENIALKAEFNREGSIKGTLARVIVPPNRSLYDTIVLDVGEDEDIEVGQSVYAFGSIALGTISEVSKNSSTVLLFSASGRETTGTTAGSDLAVTLIGRGAGEYEIRMPRDITFEQGGVISSQSLDIHPLATIQKIIVDPRDPFQRLLAKAPVNLQTMKWVIVK